MTGRLGALASQEVVAAQKMEQRSLAELRGAKRFAIIIHEQRERDSGLFAEGAGVVRVAQTDGGQSRTGPAEFVFVVAQLRDVVTAEDSAVMAQEDYDRRPLGPQRSEPSHLTVGIGQ